MEMTMFIGTESIRCGQVFEQGFSRTTSVNRGICLEALRVKESWPSAVLPFCNQNIRFSHIQGLEKFKRIGRKANVTAAQAALQANQKPPQPSPIPWLQ